ncbi:MAG: hypothetical protein ACI8UR_002333 [Natronomonas sp.]|jgi:hypothetical protein|uniref:hypothetical protein n=1 Tax=Natronomonas sp. TaxID=2184060 RepID=UPI00398929DE
MRFKVLPEPAEPIDRIAELQQAVPLVPDEETSCCARLMQRGGVPSQDRAKEWLTFLRALELAEETEGKYRRLQRDPDIETLREAFQERIYLADDVLVILSDADEQLDADAVFERVKDRLPQWGKLRHADSEAVWRERVWRILEWAVVLGLAERADGGYVAR